MPAPVEFTITAASLPPGFSGDPQAMLTAFAAALTVTPSEPWSSFINGGAQPAANVGPFLYGGYEWRVWSDALGTYTFHTQNGAGLVDYTVTLAKLANDTPNTALIYDASGRPALVSGTAGQVLTAGTDGLPAFADAATANYFTLQLSVPQNYASDGVEHPVEFDTTLLASGVTPDLANFRIPVTAGSAWFLGGSLQIAQINGVHTDVMHFLTIRPYQLSANSFGSTDGYTAAQVRSGVQTSGVYYFGNAGYVDIAITSTAESTGTNFQIESNGQNTRFYGYRLK